MPEAPDWLHHDPGHFRETHERWMDRRNRRQESDEYSDDWWHEQCLHCRWWLPLAGVFADDYGACSNPSSVFDAMVRFEHDGCEQFLRAESLNE
ncbi:MAG: hypothetical protein ACI81L_000896 [Verrucomicrobiales bacterium]|jgi:hypothetical protein